MESANYPKSVSENAFNLRLNERQRERKIEGGKRSRDIRIGEKFMVGHRCDRIAFTRREKKEKAFEIDNQLRLYRSIDIIPSRLGFHQTSTLS